MLLAHHVRNLVSVTSTGRHALVKTHHVSKASKVFEIQHLSIPRADGPDNFLSTLVRSRRLVTVWRHEPSCTILDHSTFHHERLFRFFTTDGGLHIVLMMSRHSVQGWTLQFFLWTEGEESDGG